MLFIIPYNEILPRKKAHDLFLFKEACEIALSGHEVHLLIGKGSLSDQDLFDHYGIYAPIQIHRLPIIRKNNPFNLSWNLPFFIACQRMIKRLKPDIVLLSILKQAIFHLNRRIGNTIYLYEVHEVAAYPTLPRGKHFDEEKMMLMHCDKVLVTTHALKKLLEEAPYKLKTPIDVVPLAVDHGPLPAYNGPPILTYVGQLYKEQGVADLIDAVKDTNVHLQIVGGREEEIAKLNPHLPNITFTGFIKPNDLSKIIEKTTAFVAPFHLSGKMPYVAHTKLYEYAAWGRPIIAPNAPIVEEHLPKGVLLYTSKEELKICIEKIVDFKELPLRPTTWKQRVQNLTPTPLSPVALM